MIENTLLPRIPISEPISVIAITKSLKVAAGRSDAVARLQQRIRSALRRVTAPNAKFPN